MNNSRWKTIRSWEELEKFLARNPTFQVVDSGNRERRYRVCENGKGLGISVDGRSVNTLASTGKIKVIREVRP